MPLTHIHDANDHDDHVSATTQREGQEEWGESNDEGGDGRDGRPSLTMVCIVYFNTHTSLIIPSPSIATRWGVPGSSSRQLPTLHSDT